MQRVTAIWLMAGAVLLLATPAWAEIQAAQSVVAAGGGSANGTSHAARHCFGQSAIGAPGGGSYRSEIGFEYQYDTIVTALADDHDSAPRVFRLDQNYPNPFNPITTIRYAVPRRSRVVIKLYDVGGRLMGTLLDEPLDPGIHETVLDGKRLASGVYFYRMVAEDFLVTKKLVLLK